MKIALAQQNYMIGDFEGNFQKIKNAIEIAITQAADLILFPELAICGYPPRDFLEFNHFIQQCEIDIQKICAIAQDKIAVVVGAPSRNPTKNGKDLYNSAYFIADGSVQYIAHKTLLPTYDVFDEYRYFEPNTNFNLVSYKGKKIALSICEDIWDTGVENPLYKINPIAELAKMQPDILLNLSASPFNYRQAKKRIDVVRNNATQFNIPVFYCNHVGAQTELIFDGGSIVMDAKGNLIDEMAYFEEQISVYELKSSSEIEKTFSTKTNQHQPTKNEIQLIHDALVCGIRDYFKKLGFKKAILGLSGGVDSALTLVLAVRALGAENVWSILMPSQFSTNHSVDDSLKLVEKLGSPHKIIPIKEVFDVYENILSPHFDNKPFDVTEENLQARIRGNYLMALSNKHGYILLNTTNKSEAAVGYGTLYGDMCGGLAVLADVYKTQIYKVCEYINEQEEIIPKHILTKAPSAELRHDQKDSDSLPDYGVLDKVLYEYIENRKGPDEIENILGYDDALVTRILKLVNRAEFKRHQTPPILRVSPKAFGSGRRLPIVGKYLEQ
ncbi:MAG: NAD+ synthase [Sphingobacteriales bacterium]|jgi:NAD+ synthase (glutamine-hydrolysing)|nr:MAG: NAD+ synthase [Sphingobacteriales bacterium]